MHCNAARGGPSHSTRDLHKNLAKIGPAVPEICLKTDRHTHTDKQRGVINDK